ncbi:hypothetical protein IKF34_00950 [Candidatus Saccharibacteria bacterium]|nr:hypothetical protein [Candidatus Saccharibacteria bacterium]
MEIHSKFKSRASSFLGRARYVGVPIAGLVLTVVALRAFAANPYNINYGATGVELGTAVKIDPDTIAQLSSLVKSGDSGKNTITFSNSNKWKDGYAKLGVCKKVKYIEVRTTDIGSSDLSDVYWDIKSGPYITRVSAERIVTEDPQGFLPDSFLTLSVPEDTGSVVGGHAIFEDATCASESRISGSKYVESCDRSCGDPDMRNKFFVQAKIKLYKNRVGQDFTSEDIWFSLDDIDHGQSYKILNADNLLESGNNGNMYAKSANSLRPDDSAVTDRNIFVANGNYIYSQGNFDSDRNKSDVYVKTKTSAQSAGLQVVFGFTNSAAAGSSYFARQYKVEYRSENGVISGITNEDVIINDTPSGSSSTPDTGYEPTDCWKANVAVTIPNKPTIAAGTCLKPAEVKQVEVKSDIIFTAVHEHGDYVVNYISDEFGEITGKKNESVAPSGQPTGSIQKPNENYRFVYWVADRDVTLKNGETIKKGAPISDSQIKNVVVNSEITFKAIHEKIEYKVEYVSDKNGTITGKTDEGVEVGSNPTGSTEEPNAKYVFSHWTADKDVTLKDGKTIKKGESITDADIKNVVVTENITFTAHNVKKQYAVTYTSDENGKITGITSEKVDVDGNPAGSKEKANDGYEFSHWIADKDVTLKDKSIIKKGEQIIGEQIKNVVVTEDIKFTAINMRKTAAKPNTGMMTGETSSNVVGITSSVIGLAAVTLAGFIFSRVRSKRGVKKFGW